MILLRRGDALGILLVVALLGILACGYLFYPAVFWQHGSSATFSSDWDCQYVPNSEPVCIRKVPKRSAD